MLGRSRSRSRGVRSALSVLALALAAVCMALLLGLGAAGSAAAFPGGATSPLDTPSGAATPTDTPTQAPPTATSTPSASTPTATATVTDTATVTQTATATATATATSSSGGGPGGLGGDTGPQPTKVVFTQPNGGNGDGGPLGGLSPSTIGSSGLLFAATGSCIVALLGLIVAAIALMVLVQGGYGPYLRALLRGKRAGRGAGKDDLSPQFAGSEWDAGYAGNADYRASSPQGGAAPRRHPYDDGYGSNIQTGYDAPMRSQPARSQPVRRSPPSSRSRPDWR